MASTWHKGPLIVTGAGPAISGGALDYNSTPGPSVFTHGTAVLDNRFGPFDGSRDPDQAIPNWFAGTAIVALDYAPATLSATNIAAAAVPVAGTAMTLVSSTAGGITVSVSIVNAATGAAVTGLLAIDGAVATINLGAFAGGVTMYDPRTLIARNIRITSVGNDSGATFTVRGYDCYGYAMSETITGANAGIASGAKAFKYVASVTPAGTLSGSNASVGTGDVYGFPLAAYEFFQASITWNNARITASTGYVAAVTTTATATTGDVRGTYAVQSASDGTKKLQVQMTLVPWKLLSTDICGVTQA